MIIEKLHFQNVSRPHVKENTAFSDKPRFRNGLAWTVRLTGEIKLRFGISPGKCERCLRCMIVKFALFIVFTPD